MRQACRAVMRLLFVDDSGSPTIRRAAWDIGVYILAGVSVDDGRLASVAGAADRAKAATIPRAGLGQREAHAHDIWNNTGQFGGHGNALTLAQKQEIFGFLTGVLAGLDVRLLPVVVDKRGRGGREPRRMPLATAWSAMFRRFEGLLDLPGGECGLILADAGRRADEAVARSVVEGMGRVRMERRLGHAGVFGVIHRDSRLDVMIQLADIAAYIIHKHYRGNHIFQAWYEVIRTRFDADPTALRP